MFDRVLCAVLAASPAPVLDRPAERVLCIEAALGGESCPTVDPIDVLGKWLKLYHAGDLDLTGAKLRRRGRRATMQSRDFVSITSGLFPNQNPARWTHDRELRQICEVVLELRSPEAARALLEVASVGLDGRALDAELLPVVVRRIGEAELAKLDAAGREAVHDVALQRGRKDRLAVRAAALLALGALRDEVYRPALVAGLTDSGSERLRLAGAMAIERAALATAMPAVTDQLVREKDAAARIAMLDALTAIVRGVASGGRVDARELRRAVSTALQLLGTAESSDDLAVLDFLEIARAADAVPALLETLARGAAGKTSGLVVGRAHAILTSMTGATFAADQVDAWREWWERVHDEFAVPALRESVAVDVSADATSSGFFGIPVRGTRVMFVVDLSRSMSFRTLDGSEAKIDLAKRELQRAVDGMAADSAFGLVMFSDTARAWKPKLVAAKSAHKKAFSKFIDRVDLGRSTNVWAGLELALALETVEHGARYATRVDEIFILSDGAPTVGDIVEGEEIAAMVRETNRVSRVRINTVFIDGQEEAGRGGGGRRGGRQRRRNSMTGAELMRRLAEENGGRFMQPK